VVAGRGVPPLPPEPWVVRNAAVERPFNASMLPLTTTEFKERADKTYLAMRRPKALVLSPVGYFWMANSGEESLHEAMRRSLERCGYAAGEPCMVIAIDDTFVVPIPTLMKVISFYTPNAIRFRVKEEGRKEVARRLAGANSGWNAVAVGTAGDVGIAIGAGSEQGAIDGALADCAKHDNNCRVAVLGPFLIETRNQGIQDTENP
jgi:adenylate cyclase